MAAERQESSHREPRPWPRTRFDALSDGVFGVALTVLGLELVTHVDQTMTDLRAWWPRLVSFMNSFFLAGCFWVMHHNEFHHMPHPDRAALWINLLFLFFIALLPFSAALLGSEWHSGSDKPVLIYLANLLLSGVTLQGLWLYAKWAGLLDVEMTDGEKADTTSRNWFLPGACLFVFIIWWLPDGILGASSTQTSQWVISGVPIAYVVWTFWRAHRIKSGRVFRSGD